MKKTIFGLAILLVVVVFLVILLNLNYSLKFEKVEEIIPNEELNPVNSTMKPWFSIRDEKYYPWYDLDYVSNMGIQHEEWDLDKYTYIICQGYKLEDLSFSPVLLNHKSVFSVEYIGITEFNDEFSNCIYVYRMSRMNIDFYLGEPAKYSKFGNYSYKEILTEKYGAIIGTEEQSGNDSVIET